MKFISHRSQLLEEYSRTTSDNRPETGFLLINYYSFLSKFCQHLLTYQLFHFNADTLKKKKKKRSLYVHFTALQISGMLQPQLQLLRWPGFVHKMPSSLRRTSELQKASAIKFNDSQPLSSSLEYIWSFLPPQVYTIIRITAKTFNQQNQPKCYCAVVFLELYVRILTVYELPSEVLELNSVITECLSSNSQLQPKLL